MKLLTLASKATQSLASFKKSTFTASNPLQRSTYPSSLSYQWSEGNIKVAKEIIDDLPSFLQENAATSP